MMLSIKHFSEQLEYRKNKLISHTHFLVNLVISPDNMVIVEIREDEFYKYNIIGIDFYPRVRVSSEYKDKKYKISMFYEKFS